MQMNGKCLSAEKVSKFTKVEGWQTFACLGFFSYIKMEEIYELGEKRHTT